MEIAELSTSLQTTLKDLDSKGKALTKINEEHVKAINEYEEVVAKANQLKDELNAALTTLIPSVDQRNR